MAKYREITTTHKIFCYKGVSSEEELKLRIAEDWFGKFSCDKREDGIDFWVLPKHKQLTLKGLTIEQPLLWAEAKKGTSHPIDDSFVQLILTIGKHRTNARFPAPAFLGAFDAEKMAFLRYDSIMEVFSQNDFNWEVTPSNKKTKEFIQLKDMVSSSLDRKLVFSYEDNADELRSFIKNNIGVGNSDELRLIEVTPNNVVHIFNNWLKSVRDTIDVPSWDDLRKSGITEADFFLAGLVSKNNVYLEDKKDMKVRLNGDRFEIVQATGALGDLRATIGFRDGQRAQKKFWDMYRRPPTPRHCREILDRRDLLVPQDFRERQGAYFTPAIWVEKSQEYIADVLGEDWQDRYYIWDCCAGTGNLLNGLKNKYNIYASTLDDADVRIMKERIKSNSANLLESHVFQFDFLNDDLNSEKVPKPLRDILNDEDRRKRLVIYINPPYAEASTSKTITGTGKNKKAVANNLVKSRFKEQLGDASGELFIHFLTRVFYDIPDCSIAQFSTLKHIASPDSATFRTCFCMELRKAFLVPAKSFNNVAGEFPIGFFFWSQSINQETGVIDIMSEVFDVKGQKICDRRIVSQTTTLRLNNWLSEQTKSGTSEYGVISFETPDFQHNRNFSILSTPQARECKQITDKTFRSIVIYFSVRKSIMDIYGNYWLFNRNQFLYPKDGCIDDQCFFSDCLAYCLFHEQNRITSSSGRNHWIPFTESEVDAKDCFSSHFMTDFINKNKILFSKEALDVIESGRNLWRYYHSIKGVNVDASFFDIRLFFQGTCGSRMKNIKKCDDLEYIKLMNELKKNMKVLAKKIEAKVYEHGFLLKSDIDMNDDVD